MIAGNDIPSSSRIVPTSADRPFLALALTLDGELVALVASETVSDHKLGLHKKGVNVFPVNHGYYTHWCKINLVMV